MRRIITLTLLPLAACSLPQSHVPATPAPVPPCEAGAEIVVWYWESTPCDLDGSQTLTELGLPNEAACDDRGGRWVYEACEDRDY